MLNGEELISMTINNLMMVGYFSAFLSPRGKNKIITFAGFGAAGFILEWIRYLFFQRLVTIFGVASIAVPMLSVLNTFPVLLGLSALFFKKAAAVKVYLTLSFLVVGDICFFISVGMLNLLENQGIMFAVIHLIYPALGLITFGSIIRNFSYRRQSFTLTELLYVILPCLSGFTLVSVIRAIDMIITENQRQGIYGHKYLFSILVPLSGVIFLVSLVSAVKLFQKRVELEIAERSRRVRERIMDTDNVYSEIRSIRHDMKGHLANIRLLAGKISEGGTELGRELEEYLDKFGGTIEQFDFAFQTGNSISDVIIHRKYTEAVNAGVKFESGFTFPARLGLDPYDLAVILNNVLENAAEAAALVKSGRRFIRLSSYIKGDMFFIEVENSFEGEIITDRRMGLPVSGKSDGEMHGFGLVNVKRTAQKYFGGVDYQVAEEDGVKTFRLMVMLQNAEGIK